MKFLLGNPKHLLDDTIPVNGTRLEIPSSEDPSTVLFAGLILLFAISGVWILLTGTKPVFWLEPWWQNILIGAAFTIAHEFTHWTVLPRRHTNGVTVFGFYPWRLGAFVFFSGRLSLCRSLAMLLFPFFVLTVVPLITLALLETSPRWVGFIVIWNAAGSCADLLLALNLVRFVPSGRHVVWGHRHLYVS